jgi:uncharacterized protein YbjT (DUF2867 family)
MFAWPADSQEAQRYVTVDFSADLQQLASQTADDFEADRPLLRLQTPLAGRITSHSDSRNNGTVRVLFIGTSGTMGDDRELHVVTGAFGYSGRYITERLLRAGKRVRTLTNSPDREHPFGDCVEVRPLSFDDPERLARSLEGAGVLYNTYWVRFNYGDFSFARAVENTQALFAAARRGGVSRVVHVSITNPSEESPLEYFRGKAVLERALRETGLSYAILRPAVLFGGEDILINNIAWVLRHLPVFGVFGSGDYRLQPIHVHDFADLAVAQGAERTDRTIDAIGPETFTYRELVRELARILGVRRPHHSR